MKTKRLCSCGKLVVTGEKCSCKIELNKNKDKKLHPSRLRKFQKLRKRIIQRDSGHCIRCRIKFDLFITNDLEAHHVKSWRDYPELAFDENNLITVCSVCNKELGNSNKLDFEWENNQNLAQNYCL